MPIALETFVKHLTESGIISPGKLEGFIPPKATPKDAQELARQLVQGRHLTKFQAQEVWSGRVKSLILGNYTILDKIGAGGMGQVFKAQHRRMDRIVAIKMLPKNVMKDAATIARFEREVKAAARLRHPNIVNADDADEANGVHFLVMEYVEGQDLSALVKKNGPFSVAKSVNYILQAAKGLEFAHRQGVIHRDIKPANLLLDAGGAVKILDMGLARIETDGDAATQAELTGSGMVMGTVDYMAPEQSLSSKHADARADIYSLGCTLHYFIAGKATYDGETVAAKLLAHHTHPIPDLRKSHADVSDELVAVFEKMVAKQAVDRYQTMAEVIAALEQSNINQPSALSIQQPAGSGSSSDVMTFLRNVSLNTINKPKVKAPAKAVQQPAPAKAGSDKKKLVMGIVGAAFLGAAILAAVLIKIQTKDGTLIVEVDQPGAVVQVWNEEGKIEITRPGEKGTVSISVDPGKHRLKVEKDGFAVFGEQFEIATGDSKTIKAKLEPQEDKPWFKLEFKKWEKEVATLPAEEQVNSVAEKLKELNPGFDGKLTGCYGWVPPKVENGVVTEIGYSSDAVTDISPMRALTGLKLLNCWGRRLADLSPLKGMRLASFQCHGTWVSDLSPLKELPLTSLDCNLSRVSDLSPLKGMMLTYLDCSGYEMLSDLSPVKGMPLMTLHCVDTGITDLSPIEGMSLQSLWLTPQNVTKGLDAIRRMNSLSKISLGWAKPEYSPEEFWKRYDAGEFSKPGTAAATADRKPITTYLDPAFKKWEKEVAALPAEDQVKAVAKKLQELNPGFDGKVTPQIENGVVIGLQVVADNLTDISAMRAVPHVGRLDLNGSGLGKGKLSDLSPLEGMRLTRLTSIWTPISDLTPLHGMPLTYLQLSDGNVADLSPLSGLPLLYLALGGWNPVSDLTPLKGLPLKELHITGTKVTDLSPLRGMQLTHFHCGATAIADLSPLRGMPLRQLDCSITNVSNLSVVKGMPLEDLGFSETQVADLTPLEGMNLKRIAMPAKTIAIGMDILRQMSSLSTIGIYWQEQVAPAEFWMRYDAGEFGKPDSAAANPEHKPTATYLDPAFKKWEQQVAALPAEEQVQAVAKKLVELNPGFDGKANHQVEGGVVTKIFFEADQVADISPLRALTSLGLLSCSAGGTQAGKLADLSPLQGMALGHIYCMNTQVSDLSPFKGMPLTLLACDRTQVADLTPLQGMKLTSLSCWRTKVSDLSPLRGMPLTSLACFATPVTDLSPLRGMKLTYLNCSWTPVSDLSPIEGMPITSLSFTGTPVSDLTPIRGMNLTEIWLTPKDIKKGMNGVRKMASLKTLAIGQNEEDRFDPAEFWRKYDAGEFK